MIGMPGEHVVITNLAAKYLSIQEEEIIQEYLLDNQTIRARTCLLAKVDLLWDNEALRNYEALKIYNVLGVPPRECLLNARKTLTPH